MENIIVPIIIIKVLPILIRKQQYSAVLNQLLKLTDFINDFKSNNKYMLDYLRKGLYHLYIRQRLYFEEREQAKRDLQKAKIAKLKRINKSIEDKSDEKKMFLDGFCKCASCKHFYGPDQMYAIYQSKPLTDDHDLFDLNFNCPKCSVLFVSKPFNKYVDKNGVLAAVKYLKEKKDDLIYLNLPVIKHEHKFM